MAPIFVGNKAKRLLERAVWNDTAFLAVSSFLSIKTTAFLLHLHELTINVLCL
jgi:1-phosphatidylinositol-3-phosphate 5-kinase